MSSLHSYILTRLIFIISMILMLLTFVFFIFRVLPEDPIDAVLRKNFSPEQKAQIRKELDLDKPIVVQYFNYIHGVFKGDLGRSMLTGRPVLKEILERFPATLELIIFSFLIAFLLGSLLGIRSVQGRGAFDSTLKFYPLIVYVLPVFWLGMIFQLLLGVKLGILPISGRISPLVKPSCITGLYLLDSLVSFDFEVSWDALKHLFLPSFLLGIFLSGMIFKIIRRSIMEMLRMDFIRSARARGISEGVIFYRYAVKGALISAIASFTLEFAFLLGGGVLIERAFSWPGLGAFLVTSIECGDLTIVQGVIVFYIFLIALVKFIVDVIHAYLDPRIRLGEE
ncbi:MAG: ABC transporter permease [Synergistetes bacterium]|nr:ABC transporter permease [Synergistota bacterium]MCX8128412.1 ABC transporter permease [Synergistota bacterium]MDW8192910.1 ABC transporter permease [Synergistota bacterium]